MDWLDNLRNPLAKARKEIEERRQKIELLLRRREDLMRLPLPLADFIAHELEQVDRMGESYLEDLAAYRLKCFPSENYGFEAYSGENVPRFLWWSAPTHRGALASADAMTISRTALAWYFGPQIKARLKEALERADLQWPELVGPPRAEREVEIRSIDAELATLRAEEAELMHELRSLGIGGPVTEASSSPAGPNASRNEERPSAQELALMNTDPDGPIPLAARR